MSVYVVRPPVVGPAAPAPVRVAAPSGMPAVTRSVVLQAPTAVAAAPAAAPAAIGAHCSQGPRPPYVSGSRQFINPKSFAMRYKFNGDFQVRGRPLLLTIDPIDSQRSFLATGLRVWDGGIVLAKYLERYVPALLQASRKPQLRGLELGCGTGVAGLSFALAGQQVVLSDLGDLQAAATRGNIASNLGHITAAGGSATYENLDWRCLPDRAGFGFFDVVFAGDVIWHETLVEPFLQAVAWALSGPGAGEVLLSHKVRDDESVRLFERMVGSAGFVILKKVPTESALGDDGHPEVAVYHLRRR